jgi:hypothetical protein
MDHNKHRHAVHPSCSALAVILDPLAAGMFSSAGSSDRPTPASLGPGRPPGGHPVMAPASALRRPPLRGTNRGAFKSGSGGTWTAANNGLLGASVNALAINPRSPQLVCRAGATS